MGEKKLRTYVVGWFCWNLRVFWEDQTDQKSAVGGPKRILRTGDTPSSKSTVAKSPITDLIESIFWNWPGLQQSCSCTPPLWLRWTIAGSLSVPFEVNRSNQHNFWTILYQKLVTPVICCARNLLSQDVPLQGTCGRAQGVSQRNCVRRGRSKLNIHWGKGHESKKNALNKNKNRCLAIDFGNLF